MRETSRWPRRIVLCLLIGSVGVGVAAVFVQRARLDSGALGAPTPSTRPWWHTPPERWSRPREFYTPLEPQYAKSLRLRRQRPVPQLASPTYSANGGYWFSVRDDPHVAAGPWISQLTVFNERDYVLRLTFNDAKSLKANWVNDKIIYAEIWWGHALGTYALIDVESESIIQAEMIQSGTIAYQQWQQHVSGLGSR